MQPGHCRGRKRLTDGCRKFRSYIQYRLDRICRCIAVIMFYIFPGHRVYLEFHSRQGHSDSIPRSRLREGKVPVRHVGDRIRRCRHGHLITVRVSNGYRGAALIRHGDPVIGPNEVVLQETRRVEPRIINEDVRPFPCWYSVERGGFLMRLSVCRSVKKGDTNMIVTLKDGSKKEFDNAMSVIDIAKDISEGLARMACAGEVNGEVVDLRTVIDKDCNLNILTFNDEGGRAAFHHTTSHIMAQAVKRLYPSTKLAIGPSIADGFYYDMDRQIEEDI